MTSNNEHVPTPISHTMKRTGSVVALVCILLPAMLAIMGYCIHVAHVESLHARTQIVSDVIARSAGREYVMSGSRDEALSMARTASLRNPVGGAEIPVVMSDLEFGISDRSGLQQQYTFEALPSDHDGEPGNSVRFTSHSLRDASQSVLPNLFPNFGRATEIRPLKTSANTQGSMDISIVLDRSGSMHYASDEDPGDGSIPPRNEPAGWQPGDPVAPGSRWRDTTAAVDGFLNYLEQSSRREKVSLSTYASDTTTNLRLTEDISNVRGAMNQITNEFHGGWTAIGKGMREGVAALTDPERSRTWAVRVMVLMTDGIHNTEVAPEKVIWNLNQNRVMLFTITFGNDADQPRMANLARKCGGEHFHAADGVQLSQTFRDIGRRLPSLMTQ